MEGLYYCFEQQSSPTFHLLRFYPQTEYVIATSINTESIEDVSKELKKFGMDGHKIIGQAEFIYCGAFSENSNRLSFKIENEILDKSNTWAEYDLLSFKGDIINENELQLEVTSKRTKRIVSRLYKKVTENKISKPGL